MKGPPKMLFFVFASVFTAVFFVTLKAIERPLINGYCHSVLSDSAAYGSSLPETLARAIIPKGRIFRSLALPIPGKDGEEIHLGTVVVSRAGVFIVCQLNGAGILENPPDRKWKHICGGKFTEFENPFIHQKDARTLIEYYLSPHCADARVYSIVLYTSQALKFTAQKPRGVMSAEEFPKRLLKMEKTGRLTKAQVKTVCDVLSNVEAY